jgi:hypothetical protein
MTKSSAEFFTQIRSVWFGDVGTGEKNLGPIFAILYF